jgi:hypothetical protein
MTKNQRTLTRLPLALLAVGALAGAACGSDDDLDDPADIDVDNPVELPTDTGATDMGGVPSTSDGG